MRKFQLTVFDDLLHFDLDILNSEIQKCYAFSDKPSVLQEKTKRN